MMNGGGFCDDHSPNCSVEGTDLEITYDERTDTYHVESESESPGRVSTTIVRAIGAITRTDPLELEPLAGYVDPEAIDRLFESVSADEREEVILSFPYATWQVTVEGTGDCSIAFGSPPTNSSSDSSRI